MPKKFKGDKPTMEEIRRLKKPNEVIVPILMDPLLKGQIEEKQREYETKKRKAKAVRGASLADTTAKELDTLEDEIEKLMDEAEEATVYFKLRDIGKRRYDDLVGAHRPTDEQRKMYKEEGGEGALAYNTDSFPPALVSACAVEPEISLEEADAIFNGIYEEDSEGNQVEKEPAWSEGDLEALFFGCIRACKERTSIPLSKSGTGTTRPSPLNSITALSEESPTPSS